MTKWKMLFGLVLCLGLLTVPGRAQDAAKKEPPKPALSPSKELLEGWNDIGRKLIAMAEDFPEDKYEYKPYVDSRTFAANLIHAAASMYYFTDIANGQKPRYADDPKRDDLKTKAQVVAFVKTKPSTTAAHNWRISPPWGMV
jgi:hypothetical protein